jgi:hypothetical protein
MIDGERREGERREGETNDNLKIIDFKKTAISQLDCTAPRNNNESKSI